MASRDSSLMQTRSNLGFLKQINLQKIMNLLLKHNYLSRVELADLGHLDKKTITNIVNDLLEKKLIKEVGYKPSNGGRRRKLLELNEKHSYHIGINLDVTHLTGVILDFRGNLVTENNIELCYNLEPDVIIRMIKTLLTSLLKQSEIEASSIAGIGFTLPGFVDRDSGISIQSEYLTGWHDIPLKDILVNELKTAFYIEDCSRTAALAEYWFGAGRNIDDFIAFDLGLGIGCGIMNDGRLYMGSNNKSGEIGHTIVKPNGPECVCGQRGCIEATASGNAIVKSAITGLKQGALSILPKFTMGDINRITFNDVISASELDDQFSINILNEAGMYIGIGIVNALHFFNPNTIIIGGRLVASGNILYKAITDTIKKETIQDIYFDTKIVKSNLGYRASALGAAVLSLQGLFSYDKIM